MTRASSSRGDAGQAVAAVAAAEERATEAATVANRPQLDAPVGGQAVLEGVMMRGVGHWAVAVRLADPSATDPSGDPGPIRIWCHELASPAAQRRWLRLPIVRGVVALVQSLALGLRALGISAEAQAAVAEGRALDPTPSGDERQTDPPVSRDGQALAADRPEERAISRTAWAGTVAFSLALAVGLFFLLPATLAKLLGGGLGSGLAFVIVEKLLRVAILIAYLWAISLLPDLQRVFAYHGAEHKVIACYEAGAPLEPRSAARFSRLHPRCGTSFLLLVVIVAIVVFAPLGKLDWHWLFASRIVGIPLVAGIAFEVIRWMGRNRQRPLARALMWPGLQLQRLTTREPDERQLEVAIAALKAVLARENPYEAAARLRGRAVGIEVAA